MKNFVPLLLIIFLLFGCAPAPVKPDVSTLSTQAVATVFADLTKSAPPTPTLTPTPLPTEISDTKRVVMRLVPAGSFMMGSQNGAEDEKPVHEVQLDAYYMDVYEATNQSYKACMDAGLCGAPIGRGSYTVPDYFTSTEYANYPVIYMAWEQARVYCAWRGARLPTEAEWEKAARGTDQRIYPWGDGIDNSLANYGRETSGEAPAGNTDSGTSAVGSFKLGISPYGMHDMAGNVLEWVADWYDTGYYAQSPASNPQGPETGVVRGLRGGAWVLREDMLRSSHRDGADPRNKTGMVGMRCARQAVQPALAQPAAVDVYNPLQAADDVYDAQGVPMRLVPAGTFQMGGGLKGWLEQKPVYTVLLEAYAIDKYEVTNALYAQCVQAGACAAPKQTDSATHPTYYGNTEFDDYPVIHVDWSMAKTYCEWRGAKLPSEAEWEKAARGTDQRPYPWGEYPTDGNGENRANYNTHDTSAVGDYPLGASPYGAQDMLGNVYEWVSDQFDPYREEIGSRHVIRGGSWAGTALPEVSTMKRFVQPGDSATGHIGMRCASDSVDLLRTRPPANIAPEMTDAQGVSMRLVPAGRFWMGRDNVSDGDEKPMHRVKTADIYMDMYEVTNALYQACVQAGGCSAPTNEASSTRSSYYGNPKYADYPVIFVNWDQAKTYCEWRGARLPSEAEWEKAAGGTDQRTYPWGEAVIDKSLANYNEFVGDTSAVGSYPAGVSPYGLYDMGGNVSEWVADWFDRYAESTVSQPCFGNTNRVIRGGSWRDLGYYLRVSSRTCATPDKSGTNVGFRCARPAP
jgi:formylglycine-generating enzyme required for sulfatase activity